MKIRWTALAIMTAAAALTVPQAASQFNATAAHAHAAVSGELAVAARQEQHDGHGNGDQQHGAHGKHAKDYDQEFNERDEFRQSYTLAPGAPVRVSGINGRVEIETTAAGGAAEVHVVRSARRRADLEHRKVFVEQAAGGLVVRGENSDNDSRRGEQRQVRHLVTLRIPRNVELTASGINGRTTVGEVDGPVKLSGINGRVEVGQARGYTDISGINGSVSMLITQLGERGIRVSGVNGRVELKFSEVLNADLAVNGINGAVHTDGLPNVTLQGRISRTNFNARIGAGGPPIKVSGVNGSVHLAPRM